MNLASLAPFDFFTLSKYLINVSIFQFIVEFSLSGYFLSSLGSTDCVIFVAEYSDIFSSLRSKIQIGHLGDPPQGGRYYIVTWVLYNIYGIYKRSTCTHLNGTYLLKTGMLSHMNILRYETECALNTIL